MHVAACFSSHYSFFCIVFALCVTGCCGFAVVENRQNSTRWKYESITMSQSEKPAEKEELALLRVPEAIAEQFRSVLRNKERKTIQLGRVRGCAVAREAC